MSTNKRPSRYGYSYRKQDRPQQPDKARHTRGATSSRLRFRLFGMHWRAMPLYRQAGSPFGEGDAGLLLWLEFGRRSCSN